MSVARATKKSAFSCHQCRSRKVRCGAESPACKRCVDRGETCVYLQTPTLSYTERLERRVRELEDEVRRLRRHQPTSQTADVNAASPDGEPSGEAAAAAALTELKSPTTQFGGLKLDSRGVITYHGPTSFFQESSSGPFQDLLLSETSKAKAPAGSEIRERLVSNAWEQRALESISGIPEPFQYLLDLHWSWIQPLFNFIYRPAFSRDIDVMGPYYSHTLMNAIISHSIRWGRRDPSIREKLRPYDDGEVFARQARLLLFDELSRGVCTVPTVQTLLLLSASECSAGNSTQAWIYSGIAFRLVDHLGIFVDGQRYAGSVPLSDEDIEIRNRLFWSCYFYDKMISLYLGRPPQLQHSTVSPPQSMLDDSAETELWTPHGVEFPGGQQYPPAQAHSTSCFMQMCQLSVIFNQILIHMYDPSQQNTLAEMQACIDVQGAALDQWWDKLPAHLKLDVFDRPQFPPPSHIVTLNCLYHVFRILLYRPTLKRRDNGAAQHQKMRTPKHLLDCVSSAFSIIAHFDLFCTWFGHDHCILSLSYSVYIAASIFLLQVEASPDDQQAVHRLQFCVQSLEAVKDINPVIYNALNPIHDKIKSLGINMVAPSDTSQYQNEIAASSLSGFEGNLQQRQEGDTNSYVGFAPAVNEPLFRLDVSQTAGFDIAQNVFDAVSELEPISVRIQVLD